MLSYISVCAHSVLEKGKREKKADKSNTNNNKNQFGSLIERKTTNKKGLSGVNKSIEV